MSPARRSIRLLSAFVAVLALPPTFAQSLDIGSGEARRGEALDIPVRYAAEASGVVGFNLAIVYDPSRFDPPTCTAFGGGQCAVNHGSGRVALIAVNPSLAPLPSGTYMTVRFPLRGVATRGTTRLGARQIDFANASGAAVDGTIYTGQIRIR